MRKISFEWVVVMNDKTEHVLTPNQYEFYKENWNDGQMFFRDFTINPSFVAHIYKREAEELFNSYRCGDCNGNGHTTGKVGSDPFSWPECPRCEGTGLDLRT